MAIKTDKGDLLSHQVASASATIDFTGFISAEYDRYRIILDHVIPATDAVELYMRVGTSGTYDTATNYTWSSTRYGIGYSGTGNTIFQLVDDTAVAAGNDAGRGSSGEILLFSPFSSSLNTTYTGLVNSTSTTASMVDIQVAGIHANTTSHTDVRLYFSSGNVGSGTFELYGVR